MTFKAAVLGSPIEHSLSPKLHGAAYEILGIAGHYTSFEVTSAELPSFLIEHGPLQWRGFSLTMPLKESVLPLLTQVEPPVMESGSANTIVAKNGGWSGFNTDYLGFRYLLKDLEFKTVSVIGGGGTAKSALLALRNEGAAVQVFRRDDRRDAQLREIAPGVEILDWARIDEAFSADLVINATPISAAADYLSVARAVPVVIDALYAPWPPPLLSVQSGRIYLSGLELLVAQGMEQIALFAEIDFDRDDLFVQLLEAIRPQ